MYLLRKRDLIKSAFAGGTDGKAGITFIIRIIIISTYQ